MKHTKHIAILGGGPSALFMFKRLVDAGDKGISITIFEKKAQLGIGMPYSTEGACDEHITNVSGNEIPELVLSVADWITTAPAELLDRYHITPESYNDYKVLPRLLFGQYLAANFNLLLQQAQQIGIKTKVQCNSRVTDIIDYPDTQKVGVEVNNDELFEYDQVVICTGHRWPKKHEGIIPGYFDSPYPPAKLNIKTNQPVAIKGSSLTAFDAIRTLARANGHFEMVDKHKRVYHLNNDSAGFKMIMHSRDGMLPAVRFHLEDTHLSKDNTLSIAEMQNYRAEHNGFLSLDFVFEHNFKDAFRDKDPAFYAQIKDMTIEEFVAWAMELREKVEPFHLFRAEYIEAERSIKRRESVYWKEAIAILSFAMNYPAKYLSAEDMQRLQKTLMPLISIVIAFVPQSSCEEVLALHNAGVLDIVAVGYDSEVLPDSRGGASYNYTNNKGDDVSVYFNWFVDCVGQPHLSFRQVPYKSLVSQKTISPARLKFEDEHKGAIELESGNADVETDGRGNYYLNVPGIAINDNFQVVDDFGAFNPRIYMMAVPYIGGNNPDYSGLDFCEAASERIVNSILVDEE